MYLGKFERQGGYVPVGELVQGALVYCARSGRPEKGVHKGRNGVCAAKPANQSGPARIHIKIGGSSGGECTKAEVDEYKLIYPQLTAKNLPRLDEDERLGPVIDHLASSFLSGVGASDYQASGESGSGAVVTAEMIDDVARKHFAPCMRNLYERLKRDHHMKHFGRLQLTLFLKVSSSITDSRLRG